MSKEEIITKIWVNNNWKNVDPNKPPISSRELDSFLFYNNAPKCFMKTNGYWFKIKKDATLIKVGRVLYTLSLQDWLKISLKNE